MLKICRIPGLGFVLVSVLLLAHQAFADGVWFNPLQQDYNGIPVCQAAGDQRHVRLVTDEAGGVIVVWHTHSQHSKIYIQHIDAAGNTLWTANGIPVSDITTSVWAAQPQIVSDGSGGAIVVWDPCIVNYDIYCQKTDAAYV